MALALSMNGVSKRYRLGAIGSSTLRDDASRWWAALRGRAPRATTRDIWALRDVELDVREGEILGILGANGAGKSTLLKIISRITAPTAGEIRIAGRIGSLLEVGTGFHSDLSGRENVYLNGAILGMKKAEIARKFDEIVAFSGVETFIDTPVKRYSSGMAVRLAFAVAAHFEPEILVIDEVLAVGDAEFQRKCMGKMSEVGRQGRTVLFVSHNMPAVRRLCGRAVLLEQGRLTETGSPDQVVDAYLSRVGTPAGDPADWSERWNPREYRDAFRILSARAVQQTGGAGTMFRMDEPIGIEIRYRVLRRFSAVRLSVHLRTRDDTLVLTSTDADDLAYFGDAREPGEYRACCCIPGELLAPGGYRVHLGAYLPDGQIVGGSENAIMFDVAATNGAVGSKMYGVVSPPLQWECTEVAHAHDRHIRI